MQLKKTSFATGTGVSNEGVAGGQAIKLAITGNYWLIAMRVPRQQWIIARPQRITAWRKPIMVRRKLIGVWCKPVMVKCKPIIGCFHLNINACKATIGCFENVISAGNPFFAGWVKLWPLSMQHSNNMEGLCHVKTLQIKTPSL